MKIDLTVNLVTFDGQPVTERKDDQDIPMPLGKLIELACINANPQKYADLNSKLQVYRLLKKVHPAKFNVEISAEEIALAKSLIGDSFAPHIVGAAVDALEGNA